MVQVWEALCAPGSPLEWRPGLARDSNPWPDSCDRGWTRMNTDGERQKWRDWGGNQAGIGDDQHETG